MRIFVLLFATFCVVGIPLLAMGGNFDKKTILIILGAPGAGKGTQAVYLIESYGIPQIATGDLFRANLKNKTPIGLKAKSYMDQGQLVPDEVVLEMLFTRLKQADCQKGFILDGVPRTVYQAEALQNYFTQTQADVVAISLEVPDEMLVERLTGRVVCEGCGAPYHLKAFPPKAKGVCDRCGGKVVQRKDDTEAVVRNRLQVFHDQTEPVKHFFEQQGNLILIDGSVSKEHATSQIQISLKKALS